MKKFFVMLILPIAIFMTGCSAMEEVSESLNYVTEAADYVEQVNQFANELPAVAEAAVNDMNSRIELEELLTEMQAEIGEYNLLEAPTMLEELHNQVIEHNAELTKSIEVYLENIEAGTLREDLLSEIGLLEEIAVYQDLLTEIKKISEQ